MVWFTEPDWWARFVCLMPGVILAQAQAHLDAWLAADLAVAGGQSYTLNGRTLTRADARLIKSNIEYWESRVRRLETNTDGGITVRGAVPLG